MAPPRLRQIRFSTGFGVTSGSALIHDFCNREVSNAVHLTLDTGFTNGEASIKPLVSVNLSLGDQQLAAQFQEIPLDLRMVEAKRQTTNNPASAVRNTGGRNGPQGLEEPVSEEILREMCDKNYHQLLPLIAEKMQKEKEQKDKLNAVKARLIYDDESETKIRNREESQYSESKTPTARTEQRRKHRDRHSRSPSPHASVFKRLRTDRAPSPQLRLKKEGGVFNRRHQQKGASSRTTSRYSESQDSEDGHWKSKSRRHRSSTYEDDLSQPWTCEERNPFTPRIRHFSLPRTRMPNHVKTYDGSGDPEDHLKQFQSAAKIEGWAMQHWLRVTCHNSTLTGNARVCVRTKLPKDSIDSYQI
ncbi:reverse transcriptase domain-containing protein [Tanacetum coccineum]